MVVGTRMSFVTTAYGPPWGGIEGGTAGNASSSTSTSVVLTAGEQKLAVAVDPSVVPYGTKLTFDPNPFGNPRLVFTACDTGGAIKGNRIDFYIASGRTAQNGWGIRNSTGVVVGSGPPSDVAILGQAGSTSPAKGGVAGLGGTGTVVNGAAGSTYQFQIGTTSNKDEDVWTGINRLAQEVSWYLFSSGEVLYYLDGEEMIAQQPAVELDRVKDAARIESCQGNWDNTAYAYVSTHRRKFTLQRKTKVQPAISPTQITMSLICGIDEIRAGDVLELSSFGPMDGRWIVGSCRRSVFSVTSDLTLVPPIAPISEAAAAGTTGKKQSAASGAVLGGKGTGGYVNPFSQIKNLSPERVDMGVDYSAPAGSPILAIGDATILGAAASGTGWTSPMNTQACVYYRLDTGAHAGKTIYVSEDIRPTVRTGDKVKAGQAIAEFIGSSTGLETGWGSGTPYGCLAAHLGQQAPGDPGAWVSAAGASFNRFLVSLGAKSGVLSGPSHGTNPPGYP